MLGEKSSMYLSGNPQKISDLFHAIASELQENLENPYLDTRMEVEKSFLDLVYFAIINDYPIDCMHVANLFRCITAKADGYYCIAGHLLKLDFGRKIIPSIAETCEILTNLFGNALTLLIHHRFSSSTFCWSSCS